MTPRQGQLSLASDHGAPPTMVTAWWSSSTDRAGRSPRCELLTGSSIAVIQAGQSVDVGRLLALGATRLLLFAAAPSSGLLALNVSGVHHVPQPGGGDPAKTGVIVQPTLALVGPTINRRPGVGWQKAGSTRRPNVAPGRAADRSELRVEAAIAGPVVLHLAEPELKRLVHQAEKAARQDAANADTVEQGAAPVRPRLLARRRA